MTHQTVYFFSTWSSIARVVIVGSLMYVAVAVLLRLGGSRTLANLNVFDFIVTVAIGSALGRALTAREVGLSEAIAAFLVLIGLQYGLSSLLARSPRLSKIINTPSLLFYKGQFNEREMRRERLNRDELRAAARKQGVGSLSEIDAIILEASGGFSIIRDIGDGSALSDKINEEIEQMPRRA